MKSSARTRSLAMRAAWYSSATSASICRGAPGRCTLTATCLPFGSVARCTWPIEAAAIGSSSNSAKSWPIVRPRSSSITFSTSEIGNGRTSSCRPRSSAMMSGGSTSGRVESSWPNLTKVGPRLPGPRARRSQQRLHPEVRKANEQQVGAPLDAEVPRTPLRRELPAEHEQPLELEKAVADAQQGTCDCNEPVARCFREQICEHAEVERDLLRVALPRPAEQLDDEVLHQAVGCIAATAHRPQRETASTRHGMEKAADRVAALGDREEGLRLAELIVHRHREAALDVRAAPRIGHTLQLCA